MEDTTPKSNETKSPVALREEAILAFWKEKEIFEKSLGEHAPLDGARLFETQAHRVALQIVV